MKQRHILITGGAGFIGSHLATELLTQGHRVRVMDSLEAQVHGDTPSVPGYLHPNVEFFRGDLRNKGELQEALAGIDTVYHFAAAVGVGQSMYEVDRYTAINNQGTANLLQCLIERPVQRLLVASSMSVYGEGLYRQPGGEVCSVPERSLEQLKQAQWEVRNEDDQLLEPVPTPESKQPLPSSIYALGKLDQERMCLIVGKAYNIPTTAFRFFNVYGPHQALSNPYTGVIAIFASRYLNGKQPQIFEDGQQQRDFVHVKDVARCCRLALDNERAHNEVFNVGSGQPITIEKLTQRLAEAMGRSYLGYETTGKYRVGDIRHCFADISKARDILGYTPEVRLEDGMRELAQWLEGEIATDHTEAARSELTQRGLTL
ncbi:MAG: NAD-dependent epimerase/dehydratase family protein [Verrucomicrobiota bacterium JB022]|nr:NAD-dependent epimerase/dehydratase family protein [Verrucomicrobiota bacterium JB022]